MKPYPWQLNLWSHLEQRLLSEKMPHALLFSGTEGLGKLHFALSFVQRLFCEDVQQGVSCGQCKACHLLSVNNHPDQYRVASPEDKKNISVDQIRKLISYVNLKPHSAIKKVAIIESVELMNVNSANSLLKTLEEPPESCLLILLTQRPEQLLATIRSRCQVIQLTVPDTKIVLPWLNGKLSNDKQAEQLLALAGGAPLQALAFDEKKMISQRDDMFVSLQTLLKGNKNPVIVASTWMKMDFDITLLCMTSWVIDMVRLSVDDSPPVLKNIDSKTALLAMTRQIKLSRLMTFNAFLTTIPDLRRSNINVQLILEEMLVQWVNLKT